MSMQKRMSFLFLYTLLASCVLFFISPLRAERSCLCNLTWTVCSMENTVENIDSKVDVVDFELGECCATVNSKLDVIDAEVSIIDRALGECCTTVNSKLDVIDLTLDCCCATVNSKLDVIGAEVSIIDRALGECCTTVNSKLDVIDLTLDSCCVTVNSKLDVLLDNCAPITISGQTTITTSGYYCLTSGFSVPSGDGITINASNVVLDLNNRTITGTGGNNGVVVASGTKKVKIFNGTICDMAQYGILL